MTQSDNWMWHYLAGILLLGVGLGMQFGLAGIIMSAGVVLTIGGFGQFILVKVQKIVSQLPPADRGTGE